ncbi:hypothetical protein Tco_0174398 [Tanacetum coccineum]
MAVVNDVPHLVDKKGGSYAAIAPKLEPGKFNKYKKPTLAIRPCSMSFPRDGVNLSKHEINVGFVNSLLEKSLTFSQGLRNANHTQTLNLAYIYGRFVYEDNLIQRRYSDTKKALIATPSSTAISTTFFSNNSLEFPKPKDLPTKEKRLVAETFDWDEEEASDDEEVTQVKVLMALADNELTVGKSHTRNGEWVDITIRKVNTLISMDEDADWQNYLKYINIDLKFVEEQRLNLLSKYNKMVFELNKCRDELLILKQAKLDAVTFQIQNTELTKLNHALQEQLKEEKKINEKWLTSSKKVSQCIRFRLLLDIQKGKDHNLRS